MSGKSDAADPRKNPAEVLGTPHEMYIELLALLSYPRSDVLNIPSVTLLLSVSSTWQLSGLHHGRILLLESLPYSL